MLGAGDLERLGRIGELGGREPDLHGHARHRVLLHPEVGQEEAVQHVHGAELYPHRAVLDEDDVVQEPRVVGGGGVRGVDAGGVLLGGQLVVGAPQHSSLPG
jgi:hypothetical protein